MILTTYLKQWFEGENSTCDFFALLVWRLWLQNYSARLYLTNIKYIKGEGIVATCKMLPFIIYVCVIVHHITLYAIILMCQADGIAAGIYCSLFIHFCVHWLWDCHSVINMYAYAPFQYTNSFAGEVLLYFLKFELPNRASNSVVYWYTVARRMAVLVQLRIRIKIRIYSLQCVGLCLRQCRN